MESDYRLETDGRFVIKNYNQKKPFSNFLPGIAGLYGTPMWVFYVNRGQGIASFGTKNKDSAILEFFPANKAYQNVTSLGFRTFIKFGRHAKGYEPFRENFDFPPHSVEQSMEISSHELVIKEINKALGLQITVKYFTVPGEPLAALARELELTNISNHALELEVLDGLPQVNPYGMNEFFMKNMSRTIEAWMIVENAGPKKAPFFRLKVDPADRPEVVFIEEGNFFLSTLEDGRRRSEPLDVVVDPSKVFGSMLDFSRPKLFYETPSFKIPGDQILENRTPSAFAFASARIRPRRSVKIRSFFGHAASVHLLNRYVSRARRPGYFEEKCCENRRLIESIKAPLFTATASLPYDLYCGQTYLDNIMRGGMPIHLGEDGRAFTFYVYSRKHGDLERDYNRFTVEPAYFSQGNGNYRDVNQNRRNDVWFDPKVKDANIKTFLNLVQLDGYNPLVIKGALLRFRWSAKSRKALAKFIGKKNTGPFEHFLKKPVTPGQLYRFLEERGMITSPRFGRFMAELYPFIDLEEQAEHGEGFWTDHWTYNLDLIESFLAIFPERWKDLLFDGEGYTFYDNDHRVAPRDDKYAVKDGGGVRQYGAVVRDKEKARLLEARESGAARVRTRSGRGEVYRTNLFVKLVCLFANKLASLDPEGVGVEMEADKPSWYDALNGLPGLFGSSLPETLELKRLALFLVESLDELKVDLESRAALPAELCGFIEKLECALQKYMRSAAPFIFWNEAAAAKEKFRRETFLGLSGKEKQMPMAEIRTFLERAREKIDVGLGRAFDEKNGLFPTYFENKVARHRRVNGKVRPVQFEQRPLPFFLEAPVHALKIEKDPLARKELLKSVRRSELYDRKLGMYKVNAPFRDTSLEVGRACVFAPGWLENESVWLHMEYKFLLEILKSGMTEEFFEDFKKALVPFQPAERYGRSVLENSSFIVSSAFVDPTLHGAGFVARLSGSTAEFLTMWLIMNVGKRPFILGPDGKLALRFEPHLPSFLFTKEAAARVFVNKEGKEVSVEVPKDAVAFMFLGKTLVFYHNPRRLDTFGRMRVAVKKISLQMARGKRVELNGDTVPSPYAGKVRDEFVPRIDIDLG